MIVLGPLMATSSSESGVTTRNADEKLALVTAAHKAPLIRQIAFSRVLVAEMSTGGERSWSPQLIAPDVEGYCALLLTENDGALVELSDRRPLVCSAEAVCAINLEAPFTLKGEGELKVTVFCFPRSALKNRLIDPAALSDRVVTVRDKTYLLLLQGYLNTLLQASKEHAPSTGNLVAQHLLDLTANLLTTESGIAEVVRLQGKKNLRFQEMKRYIKANIQDSQLSVEMVAKEHNISSHYVRKLFYEAGVSFSLYLCELRLIWVYERLSSREWAAESISTLAYSAGFNNLAWFNRRFKKRFGLTPSEVRGVLDFEEVARV